MRDGKRLDKKQGYHGSLGIKLCMCCSFSFNIILTSFMLAFSK